MKYQFFIASTLLEMAYGNSEHELCQNENGESIPTKKRNDLIYTDEPTLLRCFIETLQDNNIYDMDVDIFFVALKKLIESPDLRISYVQACIQKVKINGNEMLKIMF